MFQAYSAIFTTLDIFTNIRIYFSRFMHIQNPVTVRLIHVYQSIFRTQGLFRYIQNHRRIKSVSNTLLKDYSRVIYPYSEPFRQIQVHLELSLIQHEMFHVYSGLYTKLHLSMNTWKFTHSSKFQQILSYLKSWHYRSKKCKSTLGFQVMFFF